MTRAMQNDSTGSRRFAVVSFVTGTGRIIRTILVSALLLAADAPGSASDEPPSSWIDPDTGHRVVRLTREPGSASLYFNQHGYTADGRKMVYTTPQGISVLDLRSLESRSAVQGPLRIVEAGRKTPRGLFRPELILNRGVDDGSLIRSGVLRAERLVNLSKHQFRLEPNVSFTPDQKWIVFRSNMFGATYTFAVEVGAAQSGADVPR